jgi:hypothetical protein
VPADVEKKTWLADLVDAALAGYDPAAALLRLPPELRGADPDGPSLEARARTLLVRSLRRKLLDHEGEDDPFLGPIEGHLGLALDIALVHGVAFDRARRRAELAALLAAMAGLPDLARLADPGRQGGGEAAAVQKALLRAGAVCRARGDPAGDPKDGLPLRTGLLGIFRRLVARLAISYYGEKQLDAPAARKLHDQALADAALLVEAHAAIASAAAPLTLHQRRVATAQLARIGLPSELARRARASLKAPRGPAELARATPLRLRGFLLEQLLLSELASAQSSPARAEFVRAFAEAADIPPEQVAALQADATQLYAEQQRWREATANAHEEWESLAEEWEDVADQMMDKVASAVTDNLEAIVTEIKETGELGQLLAKAAAGHALSPVEKRKVKGQLIDLAKAVPALAIFAAPGGMLLLPLLAKLLPFNVLPSAWDPKAKEAAGSGKTPPAPPVKKAGS